MNKTVNRFCEGNMNINVNTATINEYNDNTFAFIPSGFHFTLQYQRKKGT